MKNNRLSSKTQVQSMCEWGLKLCDFGFLFSLVLLFLSWLLNPLTVNLLIVPEFHIFWGIKPFILVVVCLVSCVVLRRYIEDGGLWRQAWFQGLSLVTCAILFTIVAFDNVLAVVPYNVAEFPAIVVKGKSTIIPNNDTIVGDPELRWRYVPGGTFWGIEVNQLGYLDRDVSFKKPVGMVRVICMGDSITSQAPWPYSEYLHKLLATNLPDERQWEAFNMGVVGYSSVQGLRVFQMQGKELQPDYVTLYFGWNDHWKSGLKPDSDIMAIPLKSWQAELARGLTTRRIGRLVLSMWQSLRRGPISLDREGTELWDLNRVPPDEYVTTLKRFVAEIRSVGAVPILITAPRAEILTKALVYNNQTTSVADAIRKHDQYVELTRNEAVAGNVELIDLAVEMKGTDKAYLFKDDGIHLTYPGLEFVASAIDKKLREIISK